MSVVLPLLSSPAMHNNKTEEQDGQLKRADLKRLQLFLCMAVLSDMKSLTESGQND